MSAPTTSITLLLTMPTFHFCIFRCTPCRTTSAMHTITGRSQPSCPLLYLIISGACLPMPTLPDAHAPDLDTQRCGWETYMMFNFACTRSGLRRPQAAPFTSWATPSALCNALCKSCWDTAVPLRHASTTPSAIRRSWTIAPSKLIILR
jgi:hypothetical protein